MNNEIIKALGDLESLEEADLKAVTVLLQTTYQITAQAAFYLYEQYLKVGFTKEQAFQLVLKESESK